MGIPQRASYSIALSSCLIMSIVWANPVTGQCGTMEQAPEVFAKVWNAPNLYEDKGNNYIQEFSLVGRYHGQFWSIESDKEKDDGWENRRMYVGFNSKLFQQFTLELQVSLNDDFDPVYKGLYDAFIQWENGAKDFAISMGRLDYVYTGMERTTSSKKIKTMERALLVNQTMPGEVVGLYARGNSGNFIYQTGLFSGSIEDEFTSFVGGFAALFGLAYELPFFYDTGTLHLDYLYNDGNDENNAFKPYEHIVSLWHQGQKGPWGMDIDFTTASGGGGDNDVLGLTLLASYDFAHNLMVSEDKLQLALRYHYASSSEDFGLQFSKRYEQKVTSGRGDSYSSCYLGLNYYIYQQKLKLMAGVEYFDMSNVAIGDDMTPTTMTHSLDGLSFISGVRFYF